MRLKFLFNIQYFFKSIFTDNQNIKIFYLAPVVLQGLVKRPVRADADGKNRAIIFLGLHRLLHANQLMAFKFVSSIHFSPKRVLKTKIQQLPRKQNLSKYKKILSRKFSSSLNKKAKIKILHFKFIIL